jgi:predicted NBD/HSP70 family sugar kinase
MTPKHRTRAMRLLAAALTALTFGGAKAEAPVSIEAGQPTAAIERLADIRSRLLAQDAALQGLGVNGEGPDPAVAQWNNWANWNNWQNWLKWLNF